MNEVWGCEGRWLTLRWLAHRLGRSRVVRDARRRLLTSLCHETMSVGWEDLRGAITVLGVTFITIASVIALW